MGTFVIIAAWSAFSLLFLLTIGRIYLQQVILEPQGFPEGTEPPRLTVIVPARNEEDNIERCITSLMEQTYPSDRYKLIVVDDNSKDKTASIVRRLQETSPNLELLEAGELPEGWTGKSNACARGVKNADGDWYCFIDADTCAEPELLESTVIVAVSEEADLLSMNPFQETISFVERSTLPAFFITIAASFKFKHINNPSRPEALANGQFMLFRRKAYEGIGGHEVVKEELGEDMAFARIIKDSGHRLYWGFGDKLMKTRMYRSLGDIWNGFSKNMCEIMRNRTALDSVFAALQSLVLGWMPIAAPILALYSLWIHQGVTLDLIGAALACWATLSMMMTGLFVLWALKIPPWHLFFFPLGFTVHAMVVLNSARLRSRGGRKWKDRKYE